ncbi:hypothetical protein G3545_04410 [Starkeya sp. ORNL1]|uniref:hypothetical protein n=1 Tax=Starkeya sp. ORNL1 TaxID=2709380 RepID=UPI001462C1CE|nr:hypothetical protein [Starkeya sp. ORNL1]QJP12966.1 hypothetical protein G3545_04410 [Starkeya sp. ORNL1]
MSEDSATPRYARTAKSEELVNVMVRVPASIKSRLQDAASRNVRSTSAEAAYIILDFFRREPASPDIAL